MPFGGEELGRSRERGRPSREAQCGRQNEACDEDTGRGRDWSMYRLTSLRGV